MKDELGEKIIRTFVGLWAKTYSYLIDEALEDKKSKSHKKVGHKKKLAFENYKSCLEMTQLENKIHQFDIDNLRVFIRNNESIIKTQQRFKSEWYNVFTEEINKIALSSNVGKIMQSIDSIETYAYETSRDLVTKKE